MLRPWPQGLKPIAGGFVPFSKTLSGGQSLSGDEQVAPQMADRWQASFTFSVSSDDLVLQMRAFVMSMRGRANSVLLPAFDLARAPWGIDSFGRTMSPALGRNRGLDGSIYADATNRRDGLITASLAASAQLNATVVSVVMSKGSAPKPGHLFSISNRLYSIIDVVGGGPYRLDIWPWLRADALIGAQVSFASPVAEMRFASDNEGVDALRSLDQLRFGRVTLNFNEVA